jgi:DNA-binding transcriptional LysR family regulator
VTSLCRMDIGSGMAIDHRQLRYFVEVATLRSINKAAARLHIAQPALSRRMRQLEHELGVDLFVRSIGGVQLTPAGRRLLGRAAAIGEEIRRLREAVDDGEGSPQHQLHIGMVPGPSLMLLNRLVAACHKEMPDTVLQIVEATTQVLCQQVLAETLELAIITDAKPDPRLTLRPLWSEGLFFLAPKALAGKRKKILKLPFVLPTREAPIRAIVERALEKLGLSYRFDLELAAAASVKRLIAGGSACSILPYSAIADDDLAALTATRVPNMAIVRMLAWRSGSALSPAASTAASLIGRLLPELKARDQTGGLLLVR